MELLKYIAQIVAIISNEYSIRKQEKRAAKESVRINRAEFLEIVKKSHERLRKKYQLENSNIGSVEDRVDDQRH